MSFVELFDRLGILPTTEGRGEYARLFPALSEKGKEGRAASIFLACLAHIPEFAHEMLAPLGRSIGKRSSLVALTEVQFPNAKDERPDGLIAVRTGGAYWTALVEFKVGGTLETDQVERYLRIARENKIDAVITISNDIVPTPDVSPVNVNGQLKRSVQLFHVSWMQILSCLQLLVAMDAIGDSDHRMIVREFIRFLAHPSTGIKGFEQMPKEWADVVEACRDRKALRRTGADERAVVDGWIQEERELAFILSAQTGTVAQVARSRAENASHQAIVERHLTSLTDSYLLTTKIDVEAAAAPIAVELDLQSRTVRFSVEIQAPKDKTQPKACVTWLTRQLKDREVANLEIEATWPGRRATSHASFADALEDPYSLIEDRSGGLPTRFRLVAKHELQRAFSSRKGIISAVEDGIRAFYRDVGQHVVGWVASPPRSRERTTAQEIVEQSTIGEQQNLHATPFDAG